MDWDDNTVHKVEKSTTASRTDHLLYDAAAGLVVEPGQCVVDGQFLFFMDDGADALRLPTSGGDPVLLGTSAYGGQFGITTDTSNVYFGGLGGVFRALKTVADGGMPIAQTISDPTGLAFDPATSMVYWSNWGSGNGNDGTVGKMATDGGAQHVLASSLAPPEAVTVSGPYVLWISNGTLSDSGVGTDPSTGSLWHMAK